MLVAQLVDVNIEVGVEPALDAVVVSQDFSE